jgi:exosortase/archaeosortase family protein
LKNKKIIKIKDINKKIVIVEESGRNKQHNNIKSDWYKDFIKKVNLDLIYFSIKFFLIFFTLTFVIELLDLSMVSNFLTIIVASVLNLPFKLNQIFFEGNTFIISNACLGFSSASILFALIFSLKKPIFTKKLILFVLGFLIIFLINIPRLILVVYSATIGFNADLVHTFTWFLMSVLVLLIILIGAKYYYKKELSELV